MGIVKIKEGNTHYKEVSAVEYEEVLDSKNGTGIQVISNIKIQSREVRVGLINADQDFISNRTLGIRSVNYSESLFVPTT